MNIKGVPVKRIFSFNNILSFFIKVISYSILVFLISDITIEKSLEEHFRNSYRQMNNIKLRDYENNEAKRLVCLALDCGYIVEYKEDRVNNILKKENANFITIPLTEENLNLVDGLLKQEVTRYMNDVYTHDQSYYNVVRNYIVILLTVLFIPLAFSSHFLICFLRIYKGENESSYYKNQLEASLQRDLTENLNHELIPSVLSIESNVRDVYCKIFENAKIIDYETIDFTSKDMDNYIKNGVKLKSEDVKKLIHSHDNIRMSLTKMLSTLNILGKTKYIKVGNGTISLLDIIENVVNGINSLELKKIDVKYVPDSEKEKNRLASHSVGFEMDNGMMMCILHNIFKNSVEALANEIHIQSRKDDKYFYIKVTDNGRGLRDKYGKLLKKDEYKNIFINGYTTKDKEGNNIRQKKTFLDYVSVFVCKILGIKENFVSERGVGLCLNRKLLNSVGGDIRVLDTYYEIDKDNRTKRRGTVFEIKFPYKITKKY